jgi:transposase InsO family protein
MLTAAAEDFDVRLLCQVAGLAPSSYYYAARRREDTALRAAIEQVAVEFPRYGYRRMTAELRRRDWPVNRKRVLRLMREGSLLVQVRRLVRTSIYRPGLGHWPNLLRKTKAAYPNHVWVADITYVRVQEEFLFLAVLMDLYTRAIRGWHLGRTLGEELTYTALEQALARYGPPEIHHSDHGIQYLARGYVDKLHQQPTQISLSRIGRPTENGFCERLMRTLKEEEVYWQDYADEVAPSEKQDCCMGPPMYHATLGLPKTLQVVAASGCVCRHLEYDQYPELHVYLIAHKLDQGVPPTSPDRPRE